LGPIITFLFTTRGFSLERRVRVSRSGLASVQRSRLGDFSVAGAGVLVWRSVGVTTRFCLAEALGIGDGLIADGLIVRRHGEATDAQNHTAMFRSVTRSRGDGAAKSIGNITKEC